MNIIKIADGNEISYELYGTIDKPTIIFANGSIFNYKQFFPVLFPSLKKQLGDSYSYLFYDYVGIGNSSDVDKFNYFKIAEQHRMLMDALGIKKAHHFGYSKGGAIIQLLAISHPEYVKSISLLGAPNLSYWNDKIIAEFRQRVETMKEFKDILDQRINIDNYDKIYSKLYKDMIFGDKLSLLDRLKNWYLKKTIKPMLIDTRISSLDKLYKYYTRELLTREEQDKYIEEIKTIDTPFLILHGTADDLVDIQGPVLLDSYLKNSKIVKFDGFEHTTPAIVKKHGNAVMFEFAEFIKSTSEHIK